MVGVVVNPDGSEEPNWGRYYMTTVYHFDKSGNLEKHMVLHGMSGKTTTPCGLGTISDFQGLMNKKKSDIQKKSDFRQAASCLFEFYATNPTV